ncbi:MAG TPA: hypothetical protein VFG73_01300 [Rhodanobacteraceae bacterium]|nr:hypothetical protein [Rhodanobacteraceae bacterium]
MRERMQKRRMMRGAMGSHRMEGSVMSVDKTTGMLEVKSNGHTVRVHFPPETLAGLKTGDKVMLRMSFRKVTPEMEARMKQREDRMKARRDKMKSKAAAAAKKDGK